jgi:hypothetical protein
MRLVEEVTGVALTKEQATWLEDAKRFFVGHTEAVGVMIIDGSPKMFIKSGVDGGPFGGTHRGGIPRGAGYGFTKGGPSQGNIATHVEGHAAVIMWQRKVKKALLLVDRPMCNICSRDLPSTVPPGARLTVISDQEGETIVWSTHAEKVGS